MSGELSVKRGREDSLDYVDWSGVEGLNQSGDLKQPRGSGSDTEVTWQDQQNINKFGRLNNRLHELDDEIKITEHRATSSRGRDHIVAEVRAGSVPSEVFEIRDESDEEEVQESEPTHISHIEQSSGTEKSPITTKSPSGVDGATSVFRGKWKTIYKELPPEFVDACISFDRLAKKKERIVDEESKKEKLDRLADVVEEHMELNVVNRFRLIKHLMADDSGYLYFLRLDHATRRDYIRAFLDGQVN